jgi:bZIP-type transcription factor MBZ1
MQYTGTHHGFVMPTETLNVPLDDFDFGRHTSVDMSDMDFENESSSDSLPTMFYPSSSSGQFVNPTALVGQEDSPTDAAPARRMYPGMHTQQAAQAKAQQAQRQQEMARQQQQRQIPGQKPLPAHSKSPQKDPHVEESISRLLHQMRQNSVASAGDDDAPTPTANLPNIARLKKEEDEMDEDERLLASEEGKKLSSKERRQLRNKVSARAFRSRRKGKP